MLEGTDEWEIRSEDERVDFFLDWEEMTQRFVDLTNPRYADELTAPQQEHLASLARRLREAREVILKLGLDYPELGHLSLAS